MRLEYIIANPTGNITALLLTPPAEPDQPRAAAALMELEPTVEQAGFLSLTDGGPVLRMAGGEFCGNATLCAAAAYAQARGLAVGEAVSMAVSVSGAPKPVAVEVEALPDGGFSGTADMPGQKSLGQRRFKLNGALNGAEYFLPYVEFPGITHIIAPDNMDKQRAEHAAREWCSELDAPALGMMLFNEDRRCLKPLVYVPGVNTLFWESSCASGTAAVGIWLSVRDGRARRLTISEPGGCLSIEADFHTGLLRLGGHVYLGARKSADVLEN